MNSCAPPSVQGPRTIVCYICGRQYGVHSYDIHLKQCKDLWIARESQKDPRERKSLPRDPMEAGDVSRLAATAPANLKRANTMKLSAAELAEMNQAATETFNTVSLSVCEWCGRSFLPEKLVIHNRSCTQDKPARKVTDPVRRSGTENLVDLPRPKTSGERTPSRARARDSSSEHAPAAHIEVEAAPGLSKTSTVRFDPEPSELRIPAPPLGLSGSIGGSSGRALRASAKKLPDREQGISTIDDQTTPRAHADGRAETLRYLNQRLVDAENTAVTLMKTIVEIKALVSQLQR